MICAARQAKAQGEAGVFDKMGFVLGPHTGAIISPDQLKTLLTRSGGLVLPLHVPGLTSKLGFQNCIA